MQSRHLFFVLSMGLCTFVGLLVGTKAAAQAVVSFSPTAVPGPAVALMPVGSVPVVVAYRPAPVVTSFLAPATQVAYSVPAATYAPVMPEPFSVEITHSPVVSSVATTTYIPVTSFSPTVTFAPVVAASPAIPLSPPVVVRSKVVHVPGEPVRNFFRAITP